MVSTIAYSNQLHPYSPFPVEHPVSLLALLLLLVWAVLGNGSRNSGSRIETFYSACHAPLSSAKQIPGGVDGSGLVALMKQNMPSVFGPDAEYRSAPWLFNGHLQTLYTTVRAPHLTEPIEYHRSFIRVGDGGILALDVTPPLSSRPPQKGEAVLFVAHGLVGGSGDSYVRAALANLSGDPSTGGLGIRAIVMNSRGCNRSPVTTPKLFHGGATDDIRHTMLWIAKTFPKSPVYGLGFSLGANVLTKYVGEECEACPLTAVVSVANPFDFLAACKNVESFTRRVYNLAMGNAARALLARHRKAFEECDTPPIPKDKLNAFLKKRFVILRDYDATITAPVFGFAHPLEYYATASSGRFMSRVRIPFLGLNAADDPILAPDTLPLGDAYTNPWILLVRTQHGGHLGWFEKGPHGTLRRWFVKPIHEFLEALLERGLPARPNIEFDESNGKIVQRGREDINLTVLSQDEIAKVFTHVISPKVSVAR